MTTVLDCIERIPQCLQTMLDHYDERMAGLKQYGEGKQIKEVIFVASGSSYNAAFTAHQFFENLGIETQYYYPNVFVHYHQHFHQDALYVMISQGGNTRLVYEAAKKLKKHGCMTASITESSDALIAKSVDVALDMGSVHEEFMYRTLGYSTTVATCTFVAMTLAEINKTEFDKKAILEDFQTMIINLPKIEENTLNWYEKHRFSLMHKQHMMFAGAGELWPVANEADIKVMEMVPLITRSFELEEFIHGPQNAFDASTAFFLFVKQGEDEEKAEKIARFLKEQIGFCCVSSPHARDARDLEIPIVSKHFNPLEYITAMQVLAYKLADDHGRDLSRPVNASVKQYIVKTV